MAKNKRQRLQDKAVAVSPQMTLFGLTDASESGFSNSVELYDALPKYDWRGKREYENLDQAVLTRGFKSKGHEYTVRIKPAIIEREDGRTVLIYCGQREEIVEDVLRKIAVNGNARDIDNEAGVLFTLYEVRRELERIGHTLSLDEIKESLEVLGSAKLDCTRNGEGDYDTFSGSFLNSIAITTRKQWIESDGDAKCFATFHPMVTQSIMNQTFRLYDYRVSMSIRSPLARYIYKRMSHYWTQASEKDPYTPKLISFLEQSPRDISARMPENIRAMKNALDALMRHNIVSEYQEQQTRQGKKVLDVLYYIYPHPDFVKMTKRANAKQRTIKNTALKQSIHDSAQ